MPVTACISTCTVKPVTNDHPLGPEKAVFSGRWSLVRGFHRATILLFMNVRPSVPGEVVCTTVKAVTKDHRD